MKRHPSLQALSRDHNVGLVLARRLQQGSANCVPEFLHAWHEELADHFEEEERLLINLCTEEDANRLRHEHQVIRSFVAEFQSGNASRAPEAGTKLHDHIRWEERVLFPTIEASASEADLEFLAKECEKIENRRSTSQSAPRRGELNRKHT